MKINYRRPQLIGVGTSPNEFGRPNSHHYQVLSLARPIFIKKRLAFLHLLVNILFISLTARPNLAQSYGAEFLQIGAGGRGLAMGGAFVALADDETSALWNPAGIANTKNIRAYLSHVSMFNNLAAYNFAAFSAQLGADLAAALSFVRLSIDDIPRYGPLPGSRFDRITNPSLQSTGKPEGYFTSADNAILFTIAKAWNLELLLSRGLAPYTIPLRITIGANMKFIQRNLDGANATAQGIDIGTIFELVSLSRRRSLKRSLAFGVSLFDVASSKLNWSTGTGYGDALPARLVLGLALKQHLSGLNGDLNLSVAGDSKNFNEIRFGGEFIFNRFLALRAGYRSQGWSVGAGILLSKFLLDYSFASHDLGASHRVGGGIRF